MHIHAYVGLHKFSPYGQPSVVQDNRIAWDGLGYEKMALQLISETKLLSA